ncbi:MAG: hypothetical protein NTU44_08320, partial [Bacteroidetes bacterium]|nr:hypothetical protein [Bacteroidota bacterium]
MKQEYLKLKLSFLFVLLSIMLFIRPDVGISAELIKNSRNDSYLCDTFPAFNLLTYYLSIPISNTIANSWDPSHLLCDSLFQ